MDTSYDALWHRLTTVYDADEAKAIVRYVLDVRFSLSWADILCGKLTQMDNNQQTELEDMMERLEKAEPVQYVLGTTDFCGRSFHVAPGVLIPRPETAELCQWICEASHGDRHAVRMLDIGTGSGCIAITLALNIPQAQVTAWDISEEALAIARQNAKDLGADITFEHHDILDTSLPAHPSSLDLIVSNPPYICDKERSAMAQNVLSYEPHQALFVPDDDPLRFYRAIGHYATKTLKPGGSLYFELNPLYAEETADMLKAQGFGQTEIRQDQFGKQRFLKGVLQTTNP